MKKKRMNILIIIVLSAAFCCSAFAAELDAGLVLYSTSNYPACVLTKKYLRSKKIRYQEVDVIKNVKAKEKVNKMAGRNLGTPYLLKSLPCRSTAQTPECFYLGPRLFASCAIPSASYTIPSG